MSLNRSPLACLVLPEFDVVYKSLGENLGIRYVHAALTRQAIPCVMINSRGDMNNEEVAAAISTLEPGLVGVGIPSSFLCDSAIELTNMIADGANSPMIIAGGHFMAFRGRQFIEAAPSVDVVVKGEGEAAAVEICRAIQSNAGLEEVPGLYVRSSGGVVETGPRALEVDLDSVAWPTRQVGMDTYDISGSRGCYTTCQFCSVPQFMKQFSGQKFRLRKVESIVAEATYLKHVFNATAISFIDDVFLLPKSKGTARCEQLAEGLSRLKIAWAFGARTPEVTDEIIAHSRPRGLCNVGLGLESGSPEVLERMSKRASVDAGQNALDICRKYDVSIMPYFIMFEPEMTMADVSLNIDFLSFNEFALPSIVRRKLLPYPGTPSYDRVREIGLLREAGFDYDSAYLSPDVANLLVSTQRLVEQHEVQQLEFHLRSMEFQEDMERVYTTKTGPRESRRLLRLLSGITTKYFKDLVDGGDAETLAPLYGEEVRRIA